MSIKVLVKDIDATYMHVSGDIAAIDYIYEHFSFYVDGYRFMPSYKEKMWDGKIYLYDGHNEKMYRHLFSDLEELCKSQKWILIDDRHHIPNIAPVGQAEGLCKALNVQSKGEKIEFRDYQIDTVKKCLNHDCATIVSPTASGKSLSIYAVVRDALITQPANMKVLIVVPTIQLVEQMADDFADYSANDPSFNAETKVHKIMAGISKDSNEPIYISTWQSLMEVDNQSYFEKFHTVIVDEVHGAEAKCMAYIVQSSVNAWNRYGFTGTMKGTVTNNLVIKGLMGEIFTVTTSKDLMDRGHLANLHIKNIVMKYPADLCQTVSRAKPTYRQEYDYIVQHPGRNRFITNLARETKGNTLVLFTMVKSHGIPLFQDAKKEILNKTIFYISGKTPVKERERIRKYMEAHSDVVLYASYGTFSTGINIKNLDNIIFASPYKSKIKVLQSIGRVLRKAKENAKALLFDIVDDLRHKKFKNHTFKHFLARSEYYREENFPVSVHTYNLKHDTITLRRQQEAD